MEFDVDGPTSIVLSMRGVAESNYEMFELFLDEESLVVVQAEESSGDYPWENSGEYSCQESTCNMCEVHMPEQEFHLDEGPHTIRITVDTVDGWYHSNAYFRIEFAVKQAEICNGANSIPCTCPPPGNLLVDFEGSISCINPIFNKVMIQRFLISVLLKDIQIPVHCKWDEWNQGECSKTCGTGTRNDTRTKLVVESNGGTCTGQPTEIVACNTQECPG